MRLIPSLPLVSALLTLLATSMATPSRAAEGPAKFSVGEFQFDRPTAWEWVESTSSMRKAQMKFTNADKETAEIVFFFFGAGGGGGTQANIDRWLGQFKEPREQIKAKTEEVQVAKRKVTFVQAEGTYLSGMPGGPKTPQSNTKLVGAILESEEGNVFVRLTGPAKLANAIQPEFRKMIEGARIGH